MQQAPKQHHYELIRDPECRFLLTAFQIRLCWVRILSASELFLGVELGWDWGSSSFLQGKIGGVEAKWESSNPEETCVHAAPGRAKPQNPLLPIAPVESDVKTPLYSINYLIRLRWKHRLPGVVRLKSLIIFRLPCHIYQILFKNAICIPKFLSISVSYKETVGFSY